MSWEKIAPENSEIHDFEADKEFIGEYVGKAENLGDNNSTLYSFKNEEGEVIGVWGCAVLGSRLSNAMAGDNYKIVFKGLAKGKSGRNYKDFDVFHERKE